MTKEERDRRNVELMRELNDLQKSYSLCDKSEENTKRGQRIKEIKSELISVGYIKQAEPRKNRRPPRVINR